MNKQLPSMDKDQKAWLNSHTKFNLGLTVDEILSQKTELATLREHLQRARGWMLGIHKDTAGDDYGDLITGWEGDDFERFEAFINELGNLDLEAGNE